MVLTKDVPISRLVVGVVYAEFPATFNSSPVGECSAGKSD